jgi:hypothetical protein
MQQFFGGSTRLSQNPKTYSLTCGFAWDGPCPNSSQNAQIRPKSSWCPVLSDPLFFC